MIISHESSCKGYCGAVVGDARGVELETVVNVDTVHYLYFITFPKAFLWVPIDYQRGVKKTNDYIRGLQKKKKNCF